MLDYSWAQISRRIAEIMDDKSLTFVEKYNRLCALAIAVGLPEETFIDVLSDED